MSMERFDENMNIIAQLDDEPNDVGGLTAAELKAKFDEGGNTIKDFINGVLIPELEGYGVEKIVRYVDGDGKIAYIRKNGDGFIQTSEDGEEWETAVTEIYDAVIMLSSAGSIFDDDPGFTLAFVQGSRADLVAKLNSSSQTPVKVLVMTQVYYGDYLTHAKAVCYPFEFDDEIYMVLDYSVSARGISRVEPQIHIIIRSKGTYSVQMLNL